MPDNIEIQLRPPQAHSKKQQLIMQAFKMPGLREIYIAMGTKFGKACVLREQIPTPDGFRPMGDIEVGDFVFDEHGKPTEVLSVTDPMVGRTCYEVLFSDGQVVCVDAEHEWMTDTHNSRKASARVEAGIHATTQQGPRKRTTKEILDTLTVCIGGVDRPNHSIPVVSAPLEFTTKDLLIPPYTFGVWLGDGHASGGQITNPEETIMRDVELDGFAVNKTTGNSPYLWNVVGLSARLRELNVRGNKYVPEQYLVGDKHQRLALLQGLMDTDGTISKRGDCTFDNTNKNLADAVEALVISLGIKCTRTSRVGKLYGVSKKLCHRIHFTTDLPVFRLRAKASRLRAVSSKALTRYIVQVTPIPSEPVKCITVSNPTHLFLAGAGCIPTHNSIGASVCMATVAMERPGTKWRWIAPIYEQAKIGMDYFRPILPPKPHSDIQKSQMRIELPYNKTEIKFWHTKDPVSLEGAGIHGNIHDEAAKQPYDAIVSARTTTTFTQGPSMYISTPLGKNWFYTGCMEAKEQMDWALRHDKQPEKIFLTARTQDNPFITQEVIARAKKELPKRLFEQYYLAEFLDDGSVFVGFRQCVYGDIIHVDGDQQFCLHQEAANKSVVIGVDWAKKEDYTVFTAFDYEANTPTMVGFQRFQGMSYLDAVKELYVFTKNFAKVGVIYHDKTGIGETLDEMLGQMPYAYEGISFTTQSKSYMINQFMMTLEKRDIALLNWPDMLKELDSYELTVTDLGTAKYSAPTGMHDDIVVSLILANAALVDFRGESLNLHILEDLPRSRLTIDKWYASLIDEAEDEEFDAAKNALALF